jgi:hypothetical protein
MEDLLISSGKSNHRGTENTELREFERFFA